MNTNVSPYGSDLSGLICAFGFNDEGRGRSLSSGDVEAWLHEGRDDDSCLWLHFNLSHGASEKWLQRHLPISEVFFEALHDGSRTTRIEYAGDALVAVINDVLYDFSFDASDISTLYLWITDRILVTARSKPLRSVDRLRGAVKDGEAFCSPTALLVHLLRDEADVLIRIVRDVTTQVDGVEDQFLTRRVEGSRRRLGNARRLLVRLQRLLVPEPAALFRLLNRPPAWIAQHDVQDLRESTEEFSTVLQDMVSLQERIKLLQEEIAAEINEQNNRSLFVLTIVSVLALPINIIAGLLGMNVGGIPLAQEPNGFWIIVSIIASFTAVAGFWAFRGKRDT